LLTKIKYFIKKLQQTVGDNEKIITFVNKIALTVYQKKEAAF